MNLDKYTLNYHITILPNIVLYSCITSATSFLHFKEDLAIPNEYKNYPIDCFFNLYNEEGELVIASHEQVASINLKAVINTVPLKILKELL